MFSPYAGARRARRLVIAALALTAIAVPSAATASAATSVAGSVNFMRAAEGSFDTFTSAPTTAQKDWMKAHYWRMRAYAPYFDSRLSWSSKAWFYQSAYAIYPGSSLDVQHPEWILRDAAGNKLYIPFGCSGGKCTQYAADIGNPAFRQWWLDQARTRFAKGYAGIYVDDVNLYRKVSNGLGQAVAPIDPRTGAAMSEPTWQRYLGDHMQGVRAAFPTAEIVHNSIWFAGDTTADQLRVHKAATLINLERGVNDAGLTGGTGKWSLQKLLAFIDHRQAEGHGVVFDATSTTAAGRLYGLAAYFLISSDRDGLGNNQGGTPTDWWTGYDVDLGAPLAGRYFWNGVLRRDFAARLHARQRARRHHPHAHTSGRLPRSHRRLQDERHPHRGLRSRIHHRRGTDSDARPPPRPRPRPRRRSRQPLAASTSCVRRRAASMCSRRARRSPSRTGCALTIGACAPTRPISTRA